MELFDTHAHLDHERCEADLEAMLDSARGAGVTRVLSVASNATFPGMRRPVEIANKNDNVWAAVGIHPHEASSATPELLSYVEELVVSEEKVKAIGEIGLDYHYDFSPREVQQEVFVTQLRTAKRLGVPVILHVREAHEDALKILAREGEGGQWRGVVHCFSEGPQIAGEYLDLGFHISFTGVMTFKNAARIREAAATVPRDKVFLETDAPYLAPVPYRGKRCEPAHVVEINKKLAEVWGVGAEESANITTRNALLLFGIPS